MQEDAGETEVGLALHVARGRAAGGRVALNPYMGTVPVGKHPGCLGSAWCGVGTCEGSGCGGVGQGHAARPLSGLSLQSEGQSFLDSRVLVQCSIKSKFFTFPSGVSRGCT